jgi:hypothetical protein
MTEFVIKLADERKVCKATTRGTARAQCRECDSGFGFGEPVSGGGVVFFAL